MKQVSVLLICLLVIGFSQTALAADEENVLKTTSSSYFASYLSAIGFTTSYIVCKSSSVLVKPGPQSLTMYLQKWNGSSWVTVDSWSTSDNSLDIDLQKTILKVPVNTKLKESIQLAEKTRYSYSPTKTI
jgi:hypothetical protein